MRLSQRSNVLLAATALVTVSGCSTEAPTGSSAGDTSQGEVKVGRGIDGDTISLGVLTDLTGPFAALGRDVTNGHALFWDEQKDQKVCGKYSVKLDVQDTGYVPQQAVQLYSNIGDKVLAMQQTVGSPINTALAAQYEADDVVNLPSAWARNLTDSPVNGVVGATYDVEMTNALGYALDKGLIQEGATLGHIYFEGEYGANGLAGAKYMADKHRFTLVEAKIKPTDQDMSAQVTRFEALGVDAILLSVAPSQLASAAGVASAQGLNVPLIANNPVFVPGLLKGPAADALKKNLIFASPVNTFDQHPDLLAAHAAKYPDAAPSLGVVFGVGMATVMKQILERACAAGDLTPEGMVKAKQALTKIDTGNLVVPLNFSKPGVSPSTKSFILQPADVPGGAKALTDAIESPDVAGLN